MFGKIKSFWMNIGALDRDIDLSGRRQILRAVKRHGVEVRTTFTYMDSADPIEGMDHVWLMRLGRWPIFSKTWLTLRQQFLLARNLDVDAVILRAWKVHETLPLWFFWRRLLRRKYPKFVLDLRTVPVDVSKGLRGRLLRWRYESSIRIALRHLDGLMVISEKLKNDIQQQYSTIGKEIAVWTTGVDTDLFNPACVSDRKSELGLEGRFVVMYHGVFSQNRGTQNVIGAMNILRSEYPEIAFFILGKGPGEKEFKKLVDDLGLKDHVYIHGPVSFEQVPSYVKIADVGILPFPDLDWWNTSAPLKLGEYLAMAKPVILTDIAAHRAVVGSAVCGCFVANNTPEVLADGIRYALKHRGQLVAWGSEGRRIALERLGWDNQAEIVKSYLERLTTKLNSDISEAARG